MTEALTIAVIAWRKSHRFDLHIIISEHKAMGWVLLLSWGNLFDFSPEVYYNINQSKVLSCTMLVNFSYTLLC